MKNIPPLYHWSPTVNREAILSSGLNATTPHRKGTMTVCLGADPLSAWALSGDLERDGQYQEWDLFQVSVADTPVHRIKHWGRTAEYRIPRDIGPRGIVLVATKGTRTEQEIRDRALKDYDEARVMGLLGSPQYDSLVASFKADAWDEAYKAGVTDENTSEALIGVLGYTMKIPPARVNPYRD